MKTKTCLTSIASATLWLGCMASNAQANSPSRVPASELWSFPYQTSGVVLNNQFRGSGTVAGGPRIVVSCAHVTYNFGWLQNNEWAVRHNSSSYPQSRVPLRGYWYWSGYTGGTSGASFNNDFLVYYSFTNLANGASSGLVWNDSTTAHPLNGSARKQIVGYPGSDFWFMNRTGPFTSGYQTRTGHYMWNPSVRGGSGMSGGGVFVDQSGSWRLAGVHVSGTGNGTLGAGVRALDNAAYQLITRAISSSGGSSTPTVVTKTFSNTTGIGILDNSTVWRTRTINVSGMPATLTAAAISLDITHTYRGDLQVMLTAPNGRSIMLHDRTGGSADHLVLNGHNISSSFSGINPNGTWTLSVRDLAPRDYGRVNRVSINLSSR